MIESAAETQSVEKSSTETDKRKTASRHKTSGGKRIFKMNYSSIASAFCRPKAKIDFITIGIPSSLDVRGAAKFQKAIKGRIEVPQNVWGDWITIHDPTLFDLQWLLDHYPEAPIRAIEIAVDFMLRDGSSDIDQLMPLHSWLNHRLFPQRHKMLGQAKRLRYSHQSGKYERDTLATQGNDTTFQWRDNRQKLQTRLYRKTLDNNAPLDGQHPIRLEATLRRGACQDFDLHRIAELPLFADKMRRELSNCFYVAAEIKPKLKRSRANAPDKVQQARGDAENERDRVGRAWERYGSQWAAKHGYDTKPDTAANRSIGVALKKLRDQMYRLKLTQKVAEMPNYDVAANQQTRGV